MLKDTIVAFGLFVKYIVLKVSEDFDSEDLKKIPRYHQVGMSVPVCQYTAMSVSSTTLALYNAVVLLVLRHHYKIYV